jgi:hypothetical protein
MKRLMAATALTVLSLTACTQGVPQGAPPDLSFNTAQPVSLNVAAVEMKQNYVPSTQAPHVDYSFKTQPAVALNALLNRRLVAGGTSNTLRVIIEDASVIKEELPITTGFWGVMTQEPSARYVAHVAVKFELVDPAAPDIVLGRAQVTADRSRMIMKGASPAERDRAAEDLTADILADVSAGLDTIVRGTFGRQ